MRCILHYTGYLF